MDERWRIDLFGGLRAVRGERVISRFRTQKTAALLAYLAYYRERPHPRPVLIEMLWPEGDVEAGRHNLSVALNALRDQLEPAGITAGDVLMADRFTVGLNPATVTADVAEFEAALRAAEETVETAARVQALTTAVGLYRGDLLPGFFESWILSEQQRLSERCLLAVQSLTDHWEQQGDLDRAVQYARRAVGVDPLREEAQQELIRLLAAAGQPSAALRQYRELERLLKEELDTTPDAATRALLDEIRRPRIDRATGLSNPRLLIPAPAGPLSHASVEPVGGAMALNSPFYVLRPEDEVFAAAIARQDSIVLVKGTRQVGKTSLLARGLQQARQTGARVVKTNLELFNAAQMASVDAFLLALAQDLADQLELEGAPADTWSPRRGPNANFRRYMQSAVLGVTGPPIVWGLDEIDRLFPCEFGGEVFALFRSWHNERALDPTGPWTRLTLVMAYATEAHLFIRDLNRSPFNVGTRVTMGDFTFEHVTDLNRRYGSPLHDPDDVTRYYRLVGGHPYLVQRGLSEMVAHGAGIATFEARADSGDWIFGDHLQRILVLLARDLALCEVVRGVLAGRPCPTPDSFYRLRSAGVITGASPRDARPRCQLYATYLEQHLV